MLIDLVILILIVSISCSVLEVPLQPMLSESVTQAREDAKQKILEQHVAVTTRQEELRTIGGKKVCWNFR